MFSIKHFLEWLKSPEFKEDFAMYASENIETGKLEIKTNKINELITTLTIKMKFDIWESESFLLEYANTNNLRAIPFIDFTKVLGDWMKREKDAINEKLRVENQELANERLGVRKEASGGYIASENINNRPANTSNHIQTIPFNQGVHSQKNKLSSNSPDNLVFGPDVNINQIILNRSLFILKRKFELYDKEIK